MAVPNLKEIEWAISELESEESSKNGYLLLSALYHLRDRMSGEPSRLQPGSYSQASQPQSDPLPAYGESDFLISAAGKDSAAVWGILDELMATLQIIQPRVYNSVIRKLHSI